MTDMDPFALTYTSAQAEAIEASLQCKVDAYKTTERADPLDEVLRLAILTEGANATLEPQTITDPETLDNLRKLEIARNAAYLAGLSKKQ